MHVNPLINMIFKSEKLRFDFDMMKNFPQTILSLSNGWEKSMKIIMSSDQMKFITARNY